MDCPHKPPCPATAQRWECAKRTDIEKAVFDGKIDRVHAASLLAKYGLPIRPESRTERYNLEQKRITEGRLF